MSTVAAPFLSLVENWTGKSSLTRATWADLIYDIRLAATAVKIGGNCTAADFLASPAAWALDARAIDANGDPVPQPGFVDPVPPPTVAIVGTAGERALLFSQNTMDRSTWAYDEQIKKHRNECNDGLKAFLTNPAAVGPEAARLAANGFASITDSVYTILNRLGLEYGVLDADSEELLLDWYKQVCTTSVPVYITIERQHHDTLTPGGKNLTDNQRYKHMRAAFGYKSAGTAAINSFDVKYPKSEDKTLTNLHTHMTEQSVNIMAGTVREQVYPGLAQAAEGSIPAIVIPPSVLIGSPAYAAWESLILLTNNLSVGGVQTPTADAFAAQTHQQRRQQQGTSGGRAGGRSGGRSRGHFSGRHSHNHPIGQRYCWKHGFGTHPGDTCYGCAKGSTERWEKYDTRGGPVFDATRVIGHANCHHFPPCISEENARAATGPHSFPATPGNESVFTG